MKIFVHAVDNLQHECQFHFLIPLINLVILDQDIRCFIIDLNNALLSYLFSLLFMHVQPYIQI